MASNPTTPTRPVSAREGTPTAVFDVIGTLFTLHRPMTRLVELGAPQDTLELCFAQALRDAFAWSLAGAYRPLAEFLRASLVRTLRSRGVSEQEVDAVMETFAGLDPADGAAKACQILSEAGWRLMALTNGSEGSTRALLGRADMEGLFTAVRSADQVKRFKPHPDVYMMAEREAGDGPVWLIAAHAWDIAGAARAGIRTCWISGLEGEYLDAYPAPDIRADGLVVAARKLVGAGSVAAA